MTEPQEPPPDRLVEAQDWLNHSFPLESIAESLMDIAASLRSIAPAPVIVAPAFDITPLVEAKEELENYLKGRLNPGPPGEP